MLTILAGAAVAAAAVGLILSGRRRRSDRRRITARDDAFARAHRIDAHAGRGEWADQ